ncbi:MAG TPA: hypothetical protein VJL86_13605 [Steroidobacteraceae bacterium]|nr:hypothetical protein [Steroidobacteraceae bacterium]
MTPKRLVAMAALASLALTALSATAADVEVRCEKRAARSSASVDGSNLASGQYRAVLKSGTKIARSPFAETIGDEAQFDFDSKNTEVAEGATSIPIDFIVDGRVRGYLVNTEGARVTPIVTAICRIRS